MFFNFLNSEMVKLESKLEPKHLSCVTLAHGGQLWTLTSYSVLLKILAISTQMHLNGEIGILYPSVAGGHHEKLHISSPLYQATTKTNYEKLINVRNCK